MHPKEVVDFNLFVSEWSRCLTAYHQRDQMYRFGRFDDCSQQWKDVKIAFNAKFFTPDEEDATKKIQTTYYHKSTTISPTVGVIWELKEKPGWH